MKVMSVLQKVGLFLVRQGNEHYCDLTPLWCKWISLFHQKKWRQGHRRHSGQCFIKCEHLLYKLS